MTKFITSDKRNPCPICQRTKDRDCRISSDSTLVLCHTHQNSDPDVPGWRFFKNCDKGAGWGIFGRQEKPLRIPPNGTIERSSYVYCDLDGNPMVKIDKTRYSKGAKGYSQYHWHQGAWVNTGHPQPETVPPYRIAEVQQAIADGQTIWMVEGEAAVDYLWSRGIPSTTLLKSSVGTAGTSFNFFKSIENGNIILCPDKDLSGIVHADKVASLLGDLIKGWYYCFDNALWHHLNQGHGPDIQDEIEAKNLSISDLMAQVTTRKQLDQTVEKPTLTEPPKSIELSPDGIIAAVDSLIAEGVHNGRLRGEITCLAAKYRVGINAIWEIYRERLNDAEFEDDRQGLEKSVSELVAADRQNLNISDVLPKSIAGAISAEAAMMGVRPETYFLSILTATSAAQNSKTRISICPALGWIEPPNLYAAIVAESSQRKTPILKASIYQPFRRLEELANRFYDHQCQGYEIESDRYSSTKAANRVAMEMLRPKPPVRKLHLVSDPSAEGLIQQGIAHPEKTLLYIRDELSGVFGDLNKYRGGKGSDRQLILEAFNGASIKSVRASKDSQSHNELLLSIFGGIQPQVLQKIMGDGGDADGLWGRFLYCVQPTVAAPSLPPWGTPRVADLPAQLGTIYEKIDDLAPEQYNFTPEAYDLFAQYRDRLEAMRVDQSNCALLRHFAGKLQGITARIALNLHCFWAAATGDVLTSQIDRSMMRRAIDVAQFALAQIQILAAQVEQTSGESGKIYKLLQLIKAQASISVREVQRRITRGVADTARSLIDKAVQMGLIRWRDKKNVEMTDPTTTADIPRPAPPIVDRPVTETVSDPTTLEQSVVIVSKVKVDDWIEYQVKGDTIEWIEIAFHKHSIARDWAKQFDLWGGNSIKPHQISRNGKKWILVCKNLSLKYLDLILNADIGSSPSSMENAKHR